MFTNTFLPHVGGVARSVATFAADMQRRGHRTLVIAPTYQSIPAGEDGEPGIFRVPAIQNFNGSDFSVRLPVPYFARERIDEFKPDIVHSHHPFLLGDTALRTSRARGLPLVFTHHTLYENYTHYIPFDSDILKSFVIQLSTAYANLCDGVVAPSRSVAELLRARGVTRRVEEIPTGVDIAFFKRGKGERCRRKYKIPPDAIIIGHVGRLAVEKNLLYLARAVAIYLAGNEGAFFLIVGKGDVEEKIMQIFSSYGVADRAIMPGELVHEELADAYLAMDVFVFASKSETQGLVVAEAMAAETPVIALDASGAREVVEDRRNGRLLAEDAAEEEFASAIGEFFYDRVQAEKLKRHALETALRFSSTRCAERMISFYEEIRSRCGDTGPAALGDASNWVYIMKMLKTEWQLLNEKMSAAMHAAVDRNPRDKEGVR